MGIESLIPFGLDPESGELVDVSSVNRGNACECICPSCKTPLVARQGEEKEWHFAHRGRSVHNETRSECQYSFAFSIRQMIRQLAGAGMKFRTPRLKRSVQAVSDCSFESADFSYLVTEESLLTLMDVQVETQFSGVTVDVLGLVEGTPLVVFVTYRERTLPEELKNPTIKKCGVINLNVDAIPGLFKQDEKGRYKEVLCRYIENETEGKSWAYHPREQRLKAEARVKCEAWLRREKSETIARVKKGRSRRKPPDAPISFSLFAESSKLPEGGVVGYICAMCNSTWEGKSRVCKKCHTHLYTTEN